MLGLFKDDLPWLYEAGNDLLKTLKSSKSKQVKAKELSSFVELCDFSFDHPLMREMARYDKQLYMIAKELPYILRESLKL